MSRRGSADADRPRPTGDDRERVAARIRAAVDAGRLDLPEAGRRLSAVYRATTSRELTDLGREPARPRPDDPTAGDRRFYLRATVRILLFAAVATVLLLAVLHSIDPVDPR